MKNAIRIVVSVLIWHKKGLLLLHRQRDFAEIDQGKNWWELPGGKLKAGEWPVPAARREIEEETGWRLTRKFRWRTLLAYTLKTKKARSYRVQLLYEVRLNDQPLGDLRLGEEHDDFKFVHTAADLENLPMLPAVKRYLLTALPGSA